MCGLRLGMLHAWTAGSLRRSSGPSDLPEPRTVYRPERTGIATGSGVVPSLELDDGDNREDTTGRRGRRNWEEQRGREDKKKKNQS